MRFSTGIVGAVLAVIVGTTPAAAQTASRIGPSTAAIVGAVRGTNSAYDSKNGQYLVVSAYGGLNGVFVTADGAVGAPFVIPTGDFAHYPGVAYSPDLFGGAGGFLVTWHQSSGNGAILHARLVTAGGVLAPAIQVSAGGSWWEAVADVAYSTASKEFLVVWQGVGITGQRINLNGQPIGGNFQVTPAAYRRDPAVVYNPTTNQFMVGFGGEDGISPFAGFQRVAAGSGALVGPETVVGRARGVYIAEVAYNSATNQYLVAWYQGGTFAVLVDANGNVLTNATLLSTTVTAYDALGIDYNASSGTFMMVSHRSDSQQDGGVEISGTGLVPDVPIVATAAAPANAGNFYPKVSSRAGKPEWLLTTATGFGATTVQRLGSTATGGGVGGPPAPPPTRSTPGDFDGDGRSDVAVWRPTTGEWWLKSSADGLDSHGGYAWGSAGDIPVAGDYDGDRRTDVAVYRPTTGFWYILKSSTNFSTHVSYAWGSSTDVPVPADYDGDHRTDVAVYRPSTGMWYILNSGANFTTYAAYGWGVATDVPVPRDYDGDGKTDLAVYRPSLGVWYIANSSTNFTTVAYRWGVATDVPVPGDYDGDRKADVAVYRPSTGLWYILKSSTNFSAHVSYAWGDSTDIPVSGDYDGDDRADIAVYRPATGTWYILKSSTNFTTYSVIGWGVSTDVPIFR
jgi:hypothetical protein